MRKYPTQIVLAPYIAACCVGHRALCCLAGGDELERRGQRFDLVVADRHLEGDVIGELPEPADVTDDERAAERQRADRTAGRLAHRRRAKEDARVAPRHQRPEAVFRYVVDPLDSLPGEARRVEVRRRRADQQEPGRGVSLSDRRERLDELRDPLARVQVAKAPEDGASIYVGRPDVVHRPGRMRDAPDRPFVPCVACTAFDETGVDDQPSRIAQHVAGKRELVRSRLPQRRDAPLENAVPEQAAGDAGVAFERG